MRGGIFLAAILLMACAPAARPVAPTSAPLPERPAGLSTTPAPDGGPSPAEAATYTAVAILVQATPTPVSTPPPVAPQAPAATGPTVPAGIASAQVGQVVRAPNWQFVVQGTQRAKDYTWTDLPNKDTAVGEFVIVPLQVTNTGDRNFGLNSFDFELYDAQNRKYNQAANAPGFGEWLKRQGRQPMCAQCPPGTALNTGVIFDVAPGTPGLKLRIVRARTDVALP